MPGRAGRRRPGRGSAPAALVHPDGTVTDLTASVGPPLGIGWRGPRADGEASLPEGGTLVLFTDGLFERRGVPLDEGRAQVRDLLVRSAGRSRTEVCDLLLEELVGEGAEDDVAVLAVRVHPADAERPAEVGPEVLPPAVPDPG